MGLIKPMITLFLVVAATWRFSRGILSGKVVEFRSDESIRILKGVPNAAEVYLGSNQTIYVYRGVNNVIEKNNIGVCYDLGNFGCYGKSDPEDCHNFIRGVTFLNEGCRELDQASCNSLYVSGTNALKPKNFFCDYINEGLNCDFKANVGETDTCLDNNIEAKDAFQRLKEENATFFFHDNRIFFGVLETKNNPNAMIGVMDIDPVGALSNRVRTRSDSPKQVSVDAEFVGMPFSDGEYTFFLFRETALEYEDLYKDQGAQTIIFSRIARVCSDDTGTSASGTTWTSFLKQRLVCKQDTNDPGIYNIYDEIQDFVQYEENGEIFIYGIFTNKRVETDAATAVCKFNLTQITDTFQSGKFYGSDGTVNNDAWQENSGPENGPRPGYNCSDPNTGSTDFLRDFSSMKPDAVEEAECVVDGDRFSNILRKDDGTLIISSEAGCFYQYTPGSCAFDESTKVCPLDFDNKPIKDMALASDTGMDLMVVTEDGAFTVSLEEKSSTIELKPDYDVTLAPNTVLKAVAKCSAPPCNAACTYDDTGLEIEHYLLKKEYLDANQTILQFSVWIIDRTVTCTVSDNGGETKEITMTTYKEYSKLSIDDRCFKWDDYNTTYVQLNDPSTCGNATLTNNGTLEVPIVYEGSPEIRNCTDCHFADCPSHSCPPS